MTPIRVLHISDLHLAQQPYRRSVLDRSTAVLSAVKKLILSDIKHSIIHGNLSDLSDAFKDLLDDDNIVALRNALETVDREQVNAAIDRVLETIVLGDGSFENLVRQTMRDFTLASTFNPGLLDCLCNFIEEEDQNLKAVIITGDLATTGLQVDLNKGLDFLEGGPSSQSISSVKAAKLLLPGNHDRFVYTPRGFLYAPGGSLFDTIFRNYWSGSVRAYEPLRDSGSDLSVIIIAADFGLRSKNDCTLPLLKIGRLAQGRVYPVILAQLVSLTRQLQAEETAAGYMPVVLWAVHFPPFFVHQNSSKAARALYRVAKNLIDEKSFVKEAANQNVYAILSGHTHEAQDYRKHGVRILCAGDATADDATKKQCQIIEISRDQNNKPQILMTAYEQDEFNSTFRPKA